MATQLRRSALRRGADVDPPHGTIAGIDHTGLNVRDLDAAISWYTKAFGFTVEFATTLKEAGLRIAMLRHPGGHRLELLHRRGVAAGVKPADPPAAALVEGYSHVAFAVGDLDEAYRALLGLGAGEVVSPRESPEPGVRFAWVSDPEGNLIELVGRP